jgi:regulatory protein
MIYSVFTKDVALLKIKHYCTYQERCHAEVREKLRSFCLDKKEAEEIITQLIEENYVNEERFAIQFAGGKFRMKQWGKVKIKHALRQKEVSDYCINKALMQINEADYKKTIRKLSALKLKALKSIKNVFEKRKKLSDHLLQKGFERSLINEEVNMIS